MTRTWVDEVLELWFDELTPEAWYGGGPEVDARIVARFGQTYDRLKADFRLDDIGDARTALAAVILFDQFPRNMFRGTSAAFGTDDIALSIARLAVERGYDGDVAPEARAFLYMPFMHSEVSADQERCVDLFRMLDSEEGLRYAIEHRDIVARFGRFPHRNRVLGRQSSSDELAFLDGHDGFGQ